MKTNKLRMMVSRKEKAVGILNFILLFLITVEEIVNGSPPIG
jgi:hypothetical protein